VTVMEDVIDLLKKVSPQAVCDDCIASRLNLTVRQHANIKTRELEHAPRFDRRKDECSFCGSMKKVIRYA